MKGVTGPAGHGWVGFGHFKFTVPAWLARHLGGGGLLESWSLAMLIAITAVVFVVVGVVMRRRWGRSHRHRVLWPSRALFLSGGLATLAATAVGVNAYAGYVPSLDAAANLLTGGAAARVAAAPATSYAGRQTSLTTRAVAFQPAVSVGAVLKASTIQDLLLPSPSLGMPNGNAYVYLPPGYDPTHRYPVLYLLGGAPGAPSDWLYAGNLQGIADALVRHGYARPFIVVMPRISPTWGTDYEGLNAVGGPQVMTYLTRVVVPAIDARYATVTSRAGRAIAGFSAGADASLNIALHNQSLFSAVAAIEPQGMPGSHANWVLAHNPRLIWQNSPIDYLPSVQLSQLMAFYLSAGSRRISGAVPTLARELQARGQIVVVHDEVGYGHTWVDARNDLPYLLQFVSQAFR